MFTQGKIQELKSVQILTQNAKMRKHLKKIKLDCLTSG